MRLTRLNESVPDYVTKAFVDADDAVAYYRNQVQYQFDPRIFLVR